VAGETRTSFVVSPPEPPLPERPRPVAPLSQRLLIVTGKGGVGKSTIATALAMACAEHGERTLLVIQRESDDKHPLLDVPVRYEPTAAGPNLSVSRVDGHSALKDYVSRTFWPPGLYQRFLDSRALVHFTEAAPGFDELMCLGKLYDYVTDSNFRRIVFDAPSTGHALLMLRVPRVTAEAVRTGPLHHNALKIQLMLENDTRTSIVVVTLPEEMSVRETIELQSRLHSDAALLPGPIVLNRLRPQLFSAAEVESLERLSDVSITFQRMIEVARARHDLSRVQKQHADLLRGSVTGVRMIDVPEIIRDRHDGVGLADAVRRHLEPLVVGARQ